MRLLWNNFWGLCESLIPFSERFILFSLLSLSLLPFFSLSLHEGSLILVISSHTGNSHKCVEFIIFFFSKGNLKTAATNCVQDWLNATWTENHTFCFGTLTPLFPPIVQYFQIQTEKYKFCSVSNHLSNKMLYLKIRGYGMGLALLVGLVEVASQAARLQGEAQATA